MYNNKNHIKNELNYSTHKRCRGKNPGDIQVIDGGKSRIMHFNRIKAKIKQKEKRGTT